MQVKTLTSCYSMSYDIYRNRFMGKSEFKKQSGEVNSQNLNIICTYDWLQLRSHRKQFIAANILLVTSK